MEDDLRFAVANHVSVFEQTPMVASFAPGRVNIIGEHIDYNDGVVVPIALDKGVFCTISPNDNSHHRIVSTNRPDQMVSYYPDTFQSNPTPHWASYIVGAVDSIAVHVENVVTFDIAIHSTLPEGAGVSSSAALECATLLALQKIYNTQFSKIDLAKLAQSIEHKYAGTPCGLMDQVASMLGREGYALAYDVHDETVNYVECTPTDSGVTFLVCDTTLPHELASSEYVLRRAQCESAVSKLGEESLRNISIDFDATRLSLIEVKRVRHVVSEFGRVARVLNFLAKSQWKEIGEELNRSHLSLKDDYEVSIPAIDDAVRAAIECGAFGARIVGGGFGGSILVITPTHLIDDLEKAMTNSLTPFGVTPKFFTVLPSQGALVLPVPS
jgi:galactokinase